RVLIVTGVKTCALPISPTILWILGIDPPVKMDGRVLHEALAQSYAPESKPETKTIEARRDIGVFEWRQYLKFTTFENSIYFDEEIGRASCRERIGSKKG